MVVAMAAIRTRMLVLTLVANARQRDLFINHNSCFCFFKIILRLVDLLYEF